MLHILHADAQPMVNTALRAMFAARKSVFVDLLKWDVPVVDGAYEIDAFDDPYATYLMLADAAGKHIGSTRLLPTVRPHILDSLYPSLCDEAPPRGPSIFEITRFCLDRRLDARGRRAARDTLVCALAAHALDQGITAYSAVAELAWLQQILAFGWRCRPLGLPRLVDGATLAAIRIEIDGATPGLLSAAGITARVDIARADRRAAA